MALLPDLLVATPCVTECCRTRCFGWHNRHEPGGPNRPFRGRIGMPLKGFFRTKKQICGWPSTGSAAFGGGTNLGFVRETGMARLRTTRIARGEQRLPKARDEQVHGCATGQEGYQSKPNPVRPLDIRRCRRQRPRVRESRSQLGQNLTSGIYPMCNRRAICLARFWGKPQLVTHLRFMIGYHVPCPVEGITCDWSVDCRIYNLRAEGS